MKSRKEIEETSIFKDEWIPHIQANAIIELLLDIRDLLVKETKE